MISGVGQIRRLRYVLIELVVVSSGLAGASVLYQLTERGHVHPGVETGWEANFGIGTDAVAFVLMVLLAVELFWGYRVSGFTWARYRLWHPRMAWAIAAVIAVHGLTGVTHSLLGEIESVPIVLDFFGAGLVLLLVVQMLSGHRAMRAGPIQGRERAVHAWTVALLAVAVSAHAVLGVYHTITG